MEDSRSEQEIDEAIERCGARGRMDGLRWAENYLMTTARQLFGEGEDARAEDIRRHAWVVLAEIESERKAYAKLPQLDGVTVD